MDYVQSLITSHQDFPKKGVVFRDIHPIMADAKARKIVLETMVERYKSAGQIEVGEYNSRQLLASKAEVITLAFHWQMLSVYRSFLCVNKGSCPVRAFL